MTRAAAALLFTVPGVPLIYNGDEVGADFEPYDEGPPIEWRDPHRLIPHYTRLTRLRRNVSALTSGRLELIATDRDDSVLAFLRTEETEGEAVLMVVNFGGRAARARLNGTKLLQAKFRGKRVKDLLTGRELRVDTTMPGLELAAYEALILQFDPAQQERRH